MRAFVTGASGFIGGHLARHLARRGFKVTALAHRTPISEDEPGVEVLWAGLEDKKALAGSLKGCDVLYHLAAALGASLIGKEEFRRTNVMGTELVLRAAAEAGVTKIVHFSSAGVLGRVREGDLAAEDYPPNPQTVYDLTKLEAERTAQKAAGTGLDISIVRPGWVYGPGDKRTFKLIKAIHDRRFFLVGGGRGRQTPVHVGDLVRAAVLCAEKGRAGEIYHLAGREILTTGEMARMIAASLSVRIPKHSLPSFPAKIAAAVLEKAFLIAGKEAPLNRPKLSFFLDSKALSVDKACRELGFEAKTDFRSGMSQTVAWYRENGWLEPPA